MICLSWEGIQFGWVLPWLWMREKLNLARNGDQCACQWFRFGMSGSMWGSCGCSGSLLSFKFLPRCGSIPPDVGWLIGALCCGSHSFSLHPRGFWIWTPLDATCHLYTVEIILPLWCTQKHPFPVRIVHLGQVSWEWGLMLWAAWVLQKPPVWS